MKHLFRSRIPLGGRTKAAAGAILLLSLLAAACVPAAMNLTMGSMPSAEPGAMIEPGMTTRREVLDLFGPPDFTGVDEDGLPRWTWTRLSVEVTRAGEGRVTSFFNLEVSFKGDLVHSFSYSVKAK